ncbi:formyltransferase family protein [Vibrio breoganii]
MRVGFIGCVDSSQVALEALLTVDSIEVCAVITRDASAVNADFCDLSGICVQHGIPFHYENPKERDDSTAFFRQYDLDAIFCVGWSYLLNKDMLELTRVGVIGFHPAKLPENRGRHPIIWALALGLEETASTFFLMDEGADSGPIVSQRRLSITAEDDANSLYAKILGEVREQIVEIGIALGAGTLEAKPQDYSKATYWRKRSRKDGTIDFRMQADSIHNLIRALVEPYPGAELVFREQHIVVQKSAVDSNTFAKNIEPGKVLAKQGSSLLVKTGGEQAIWLYGIEVEDIKVGEFL